MNRFTHHPFTRLLGFVFLLILATPIFAQDTPSSDFTDNHNGTVTHKTTGLTWMRCALGQTWTGSTCSGTASTYNYDAALKLTSNFAGHSDWRLPNIAELQTIVERDNFSPAINTELFPNTPSDWFWSSSPNVGDAYDAWGVYFSGGDVSFNGYRDGAFPVRLVRASQSLVIGLAPLTTDFIDNKDGTVTHKSTCLMWQRCSVGQTWNGSTCSGYTNDYTFDDAQRLTSTLAGYDDWRMPTASELARLIDYTKPYPGSTINTTLFPNTSSIAFWSSSPYVGDTDYAWSVGSYYGYVSVSVSRSYAFPVRLVRASQCLVIGLKPDLATTITANISRVRLNQAITYTATLSNTGKAPASNATLIFYFPPRWVTYVSVPSGCFSNGTSYRCTVPSLAAGASFTKAITVKYAQRGALNVISLGITDSDDNNANNNKSQVMTTITP